MAGWRLAGDPGGVPAHLPAGWPVRQNGAGDGICGKRIVRWQPLGWGMGAGGGLDQTSGIAADSQVRYSIASRKKPC
jgi:opacity protein-like surface antigen